MSRKTPTLSLRNALVAGAVLGVVALCGLAYAYDLPIVDEAWLRGVIAEAGPWGPVTLIGLMVFAIVASPIPSGPIAIAAGAVFGTLYGAIYVIIGAVLGSMLAFVIARTFGHEPIRKSQNPVMKYIARPRSQWSLMAVVFASRLIPFISFDAVSYAAGVTNLTFPRFALATTAGCAPVSFALTAMGAGISDSAMSPALLAVLAGITLVPVVLKWLWDLRQGSAPPGDR